MAKYTPYEDGSLIAINCPKCEHYVHGHSYEHAVTKMDNHRKDNCPIDPKVYKKRKFTW